MSLRKLGGETLIYGLSSVLGKVLNFVVATYFLLQLMSREELGVVGDLMYYTAFLIAVLVFRMDTVVFRFASRAAFDAEAVFRKAQRWVVVATLVVVGGLLLFSSAVADALQYPDRVPYVWLVLLTVGFDVLSAVPQARLRLEQRPWFFVAVNLGNVVVNILMFFLLLYVWRWNADWVTEHWGIVYSTYWEVGYYLVGMAVAAAFRYLLLWVDGLRRRRAGGDGTTPTYETILRYALPLTVVTAAGITNFLVAPSIIKFYHGGTVTQNEAFAGDFNVAMKLAVLLNLFVTAYNYAAEPFFFRQAGQAGAAADRSIYADAARAYTLVAALASAGILLFLPLIADLMVPLSKRGGLYVLPLLLAGNFFFGLYSNLSVAYKLTDKTAYGGAIAVLGSVIVVGGSMLFVPVYGILAPAVAMFTCFTVMCALAYAVSVRFFPVAYPVGRILLLAALAAGASWLGWPLESLALRALIFLALVAACGLVERRWIARTFGR